MMQFDLARIAEIAVGRVYGEPVTVSGMCHDTRLLAPGNLFCALPGERVDGHDFVHEAAEAGAVAALVRRSMGDVLPAVEVGDVRQAMGRIAAAWRAGLEAEVVGVTGSNGKTTVKEMLAAILARAGRTLATEGNYNNEIGVPLTLSRLGREHRYAVIEMGASRPGDIDYLATIARPRVGIVTNAASAHLEGFGSLEGVARTKGELFAALPDHGVAVINADDEHAGLWRELASSCRIVTFGQDTGADVRGRLAGGRARLETPLGDVDFRPVLPGRHNLLNALAAAAAATVLEIPPDDIAAGLESVGGVSGRLELRSHAAGWRLLDDSYNANPGSLIAGLEVLVDEPGEHWLVLGDMGELGEDSRRLHAEMGAAAARAGVSRLFTLGELARASAEAFGPGALALDEHESLIEALAESLRPGVTCLVKGSRSMAMERVVSALMEEAD